MRCSHELVTNLTNIDLRGAYMAEANENDIFSAVTGRNVPKLRQVLDNDQLHMRNDWGRTPLLQAALLGFDDIVEELVEFGAELDSVDEDGNTALILAARHNHLAAMKILIDNGDNVNRRNPVTLDSALLNAAGWGNKECVSVLLRAGADPNARNALGTNALMRAAENSNSEAIPILLNVGIPVNIQDERGRTALYRAVASSNVQVCRLLIESGADWDIQDDSGVSPRILAQRTENSSIRALIVP